MKLAIFRAKSKKIIYISGGEGSCHFMRLSPMWLIASEAKQKQADISVYTSKIKSMRDDYAGQKRSSWDRTDKETFNVWEQELAGIKASYNGLSAEYNAQMAKINWAFCNIGKLPPGATSPLPREYKPYEQE